MGVCQEIMYISHIGTLMIFMIDHPDVGAIFCRTHLLGKQSNDSSLFSKVELEEIAGKTRDGLGLDLAQYLEG